MNRNDHARAKADSIAEEMRTQELPPEERAAVNYWTPLARLIVEDAELRGKLDLTQSELAARMQTRQSVISRFENMGRMPSYDFVVRLARAFDHVAGMTLYGDFMAVAPIERHDAIRRLAQQCGVTTQMFVQQMLDRGIEQHSLILDVQEMTEHFSADAPASPAKHPTHLGSTESEPKPEFCSASPDPLVDFRSTAA